MSQDSSQLPSKRGKHGRMHFSKALIRVSPRWRISWSAKSQNYNWRSDKGFALQNMLLNEKGCLLSILFVCRQPGNTCKRCDPGVFAPSQHLKTRHMAYCSRFVINIP